MSVETFPLPSDSYGRAADLIVGSLSGVVAGVVGSVVLQLVGSRHVLTEAIPAVVGLATPAPVAGWLLFMLLSAALGVGYAGLLAATGRAFTRPSRGVLAGVAYGFLLWLAIAVVAVPLATAAVGYAGAPAFPYVDPVAFAGYLVFGATAGGFHAALTDAYPGSLDSGRDVTA